MEVKVIHNITKEYPDMIQVLVYKSPRICITGEGKVKRKREDVDDENYTPSFDSLRRTKTLIKDIVLCNDFDLFCTFTFDPDKVRDRTDLTCCWHKMSTWLHHQRDKSPGMTYLIVPERHKSGGWHFHALISQYNGTLRDSKHKTSSGRSIYNITSYRAGFSTAVPIDNREAVAMYIQKYITKDFIKSYNQRRFFCSYNLRRPKKSSNSPIFSMTLPLFRTRLADFGDSELYSVSPF